MSAPRISVIIPTYSSARWNDFIAAVASVLDQTTPPDEVVVGVDHNDELLDRVHRELPHVRAVPNDQDPGASGTRNSAAVDATGDVLVFFDDDAVAARSWLERLVRPLEDPTVIGVGGRTDPLWSGDQPAWLPDEFLWTLGCHYRGLRDDSGEVRNVWSANVAVRRTQFVASGGFLTGFGKVGNTSRPEDTEFCLRYSAALGGRWIYQVDALSLHKIGPRRETFRFFVSRCWAEGQGKGELASIAGSADALAAERAYVRSVLPAGIVRGVRQTVSGAGRNGLTRSGAIVVGAGAAAVGLVADRLRNAVRTSSVA